MGRDLAPSAVKALRDALLSGLSQRQIAKNMGVSRTTVKRHREMLAGRGSLPPCPCGKALGHRGKCPARNRQVRVRIAGTPLRAGKGMG